MSETGNALNNFVGSYDLISSVSLTSQTNVTFSSFPSAYDTFFLLISDAIFVSSNDTFLSTYSIPIIGTISSGYVGYVSVVSTSATLFVSTNAGILGTSFNLNNASNTFNGQLYLYGVTDGVNPPTLSGYFTEVTSQQIGYIYQSNSTLGPINGLTLYTGSGSGWSGGTMSLFGVNGS